MIGIEMGTTYNRKVQKGKRQFLRTHMTLAEKILWYSLKGRQLLGFKFRRQHGIKQYVVDFYCAELKLAIEADGESHESDEAKRYDLRRQREIEREGIRFLRFTDDEVVGNADKVVKKIEEEVLHLIRGTNHLPLLPPRGGGEVLERGKGKPGSTTTHNFSPLPLKGRIQEGSMTACGGGIRESKDSHHPMPPPRGGGEC